MNAVFIFFSVLVVLTNQVIFLGGVVLGVCQLCSQPLSACTGVMAWGVGRRQVASEAVLLVPRGLHEMWERPGSACASWRGPQRSSVRMKRSACAGISASETSGQHPCKDGNQHIPNTVPPFSMTTGRNTQSTSLAYSRLISGELSYFMGEAAEVKTQGTLLWLWGSALFLPWGGWELSPSLNQIASWKAGWGKEI